MASPYRQVSVIDINPIKGDTMALINESETCIYFSSMAIMIRSH